jgi:prevent-host-death family protein
MKTISSSDANRHFSSVLRDVATGEVFTVLSRGKPVATISPARSDGIEREAAMRCSLGRLRQQKQKASGYSKRDA